MVRCRYLFTLHYIYIYDYQLRKSKLNHPRTEQIKFNGHLNKIANKYSKTHPELCKALKDNICCEPLSCSVYCVPKDHKKGELKGRPIHAATDLPVIVKKSSPKNLSADCRSTVSRQLTDRLPTVYRQLTNRLPTG